MTQKNFSEIVSAVVLDLGGKNTGVLLSHGRASAAPNEHERQGVTLVFPEKGLNLSQKSRLAKRHQRRGFKRRRLAKRLLQLLLKQRYTGSDAEFYADFQRLRTFLNRRGYTYLTLEEIGETILQIKNFDLDTRITITEILGANCGLIAQGSFLPQLEKTDQKPIEFYQKLMALCEKATAKENKNVDKELKKQIRAIENYCAQILKSEQEGHKTRSEYLKNIGIDLQVPEFSAIAKKCGLTPETLANLIGHIANLQLRVLRRYFNDSKMAAQDYWDEKRLEKIFVRYLQSWHIKKGAREYQNRDKLLKQIAKNGLLKAFLELSPELSIPPFEDMNNRRPPTCRSLHLDATVLDASYPEWRKWVKKLVEQVKNIYELENYESDAELSYIAGYYEKSHKAVGHKKTKDVDAILLQRLLERSSVIDEYRFRAIVLVNELHAHGEPISEVLKKTYETGTKALADAIGPQAAGKIIEIAARYYQEIENAKRGLWLPEESGNITFRCDRKPKQKKNLREALIGHILATDFHGNGKWADWENLYKEAKKINNRSSISSVCRGIEETRKDLGDEYHYYWNKIRHAGYKPDPEDRIEKEVLRHKENSRKVAEVIAEFLGHDEKTLEKYANPYSLAQIYNIMEGDVSGFYRTCPACTRENFWRSSYAAVGVPDKRDIIPARAVRLPADTMRPFDGFLARYLDRIGEKVALMKWRQLEKVASGQSVLVPIILEQNRFRFNSDMAEIKDSARKKQAKEKWQRTEKRFEDKEERIRKAGGGICPYTGESIGAHGEFDHILPRSYSKGRFGTVFNSEINLIYASATGNRKKGESRYTLKDLNSKYLQKIYRTTDIAKIQEQIKKTLAKYADKKGNVYFHNLEPEEQRDFRHALFDNTLLTKVQDLLHTQYKMRVSGMQGYLARVIFEKLTRLNEQKKLSLHFQVFAYDAGDDSLSIKRKNLTTHNPLYQKPTESAQAPGSHVIDATMVWAHALERDDIPGLPAGLLLEGDALEELLPDNLQVVSLAAREKYRRKRPQTMQIFKDTVYAERYLSLIVGKKACGLGYDLKNMVEFAYEHLPQIFALLKPFAAYRGGAVDQPLEKYTAALTENKKKFIYFNVVREKAAEFLQTHAYAEKLTLEQNAQMSLLTGIRYFTQKKEVTSAMSDQQGKAQLPFDKQSAAKDFSAKVDIKLQLGENTKAVRIAGSILLPQLASWEKLVQDTTVKALVKKSGKWTELTAEEESALKARHFPQTITNPLRHRSVRKVYSLPMPDNPSGGFRVQRKRAGTRQFHVQAIEGAGFSGFAVKNGKVDFNAPVIMPLLTRVNSLASTDGYVGKMPAEFAYMDEWREIPLKDFPETWAMVKKFWLQINSKSRMRVRLMLDNAALTDKSSAWHLIAPLAVSTTKTVEDKQIAKFQKNISAILSKLELKPRDKVNLVAADQRATTYEFVVQSTNTQMQEWYNAGKPCAI